MSESELQLSNSDYSESDAESTDDESDAASCDESSDDDTEPDAPYCSDSESKPVNANPSTEPDCSRDNAASDDRDAVPDLETGPNDLGSESESAHTASESEESEEPDGTVNPSSTPQPEGSEEPVGECGSQRPALRRDIVKQMQQGHRKKVIAYSKAVKTRDERKLASRPLSVRERSELHAALSSLVADPQPWLAYDISEYVFSRSWCLDDLKHVRALAQSQKGRYPLDSL